MDTERPISPAAHAAYGALSRRVAARGAVLLWPYYGAPDYKQALELGAAIYLGRPIVLVVPRGERTPGHLRRVAHHVIEGLDLNTEAGREQLGAELDRFTTVLAFISEEA